MADGLFNLRHVQTIELPRYKRENGEVVVAEGSHSVPFAIARMFTVTGPEGAERGKHAHRRCWQFMICVHGILDVACDDGRDRRSFALDCGNLALIVPPTIWNTVLFRQAGSVLAVLCDRPYEADDYIRDYKEFVALRNGSPP